MYYYSYVCITQKITIQTFVKHKSKEKVFTFSQNTGISLLLSPLLLNVESCLNC